MRAPLPPRRPGEGIVTPAIAAFCAGGTSIVLATVDAEGRAVTGRALACTFGPNGTLRLLFDAEGNDALIDAAARGAALAVTCSDPVTNRSLQLKGPRCAPDAVTPADIAETDRQARAFAGVLRLIGYSDAFAAAYCRVSPAGLGACVMTPAAAFEQTPGPGAGRAI
ncbi:MAG TPA: hypothetical protein VLA78_10155 [Paracoccaceae bacterium]|nr:hypothetical protein [Paracoccaceae bacterium]